MLLAAHGHCNSTVMMGVGTAVALLKVTGALAAYICVVQVYSVLC